MSIQQLLMARARINHSAILLPSLPGAFGEWYFEDAVGSTTAYDSSGNGHNLSASGGYSFGDVSILPNGYGSCATPYTTAVGKFTFPTGFISTELVLPCTIALFIQWKSVTGPQQIFCSAYGGINFYMNNGSSLIVGVAGVTNNAVYNTTISTNVKYFLAVTIDASGTVIFYVNGTPKATYTSAMPTNSHGVDVANVGDYANNPGNYPLQAYVQRLSLCNQACSAAQIASYYSAYGG